MSAGVRRLVDPLVNRVVQSVVGAGAHRPRWGGRFTGSIGSRSRSTSQRVTDEAKNIELFRPFILDNHYVFRADNIRALRDRFPPTTGRLRWGPEALDWYDYWMNIHFPACAGCCQLDQTPRAPSCSATDLLELFDTTTKLHATRGAVHRARQARRSTATPTCRSWPAAWGLPDRQAVAPTIGMLYARMRPSGRWLRILKAGGTAVHRHESSVAEI